MIKIKNQNGVTLVELIAALALVTMVAVLIMTTLSIGIKRSMIENDKTRVQQEANLVVAKVLNKHREGDLYCLSVQSGNLILGNTKIDPLKVNNEICDFQSGLTMNSDEFKVLFIERSPAGVDLIETPVDLTVLPINLNLSTTQLKPINPTIQNVELSMIVSFRNTEKKSNFQIDTTLTRYKTSN